MKLSIITGLMLFGFSIASFANEVCVQPGAAYCRIDVYASTGYGLYIVGPGFSSSANTIYVRDSSTPTNPDSRAALNKLESQAITLKNAGICITIINNVE